MSAGSTTKAAEVVADPAPHVDPTQIGVPIDSPKAAAEPKGRGVRKGSNGRTLYPWEVAPKQHVGPAAEQLKEQLKAARKS